jgi:antitoxin component of RelBE/YafQ-DinJ toxin-antitoxin module
MTIATENWDPVETEDDKKNSVPLNIRVPWDIREDLDLRAKQLGWTRSQLVKMFLVEAMVQDEISKDYQKELDKQPYLTEENEEQEYNDFTSTLACIRAEQLDDDCWYLDGNGKYNYHIQMIKKQK